MKFKKGILKLKELISKLISKLLDFISKLLKQILISSVIILVFWIFYSIFRSIESCNGNTDNIDNCKYLEKPLWDWLDLASKIALPILIFILTVWLDNIEKKKEDREQNFEELRINRERQIEQDRINREKEIEQDRINREKQAEQDRFKEQAFQDYIDRISQLLLDKEYKLEIKQKNSEEDNPVKDVARTLTTTILRRLGGDQKRQDRVIHFLQDTDLLLHLLQKCKLDEVNLSGASLSGTHLEVANLKEANLSGTHLEVAHLEGANLIKANLKEAKLIGAHLEGANLEGANLEEAELIRAHLEGADLRRANLKEADLRGANLKGANLEGANQLTNQQIKSARYWEEAIYTEANWNYEQSKWIAENEQANKDKIQEIREN